jgi:hypothetical protein
LHERLLLLTYWLSLEVVEALMVVAVRVDTVHLLQPLLH